MASGSSMADFGKVRAPIAVVVMTLSKKSSPTPSNHFWYAKTLLLIAQVQTRMREFQTSESTIKRLINTGKIQTTEFINDLAIVRALNLTFTN